MMKYTCYNCGAPLKVTPESIVVICEYCGKPSLISGKADLSKIFVIPSYSRDYVARAFWRKASRDFDLRRILNEISLRKIEGLYLPVWIGRIRLQGRVSYYYYVTEHETVWVGHGRRKRRVVRTRRRRVYRVENIDQETVVPVVARRQYFRLGAREAAARLVSIDLNRVSRRLLDIDPEYWSKIKLEVLNTELDEKMVSAKMREDAVDSLREYYRSKGYIDYFYVVPQGPFNLALYLAPLWHVCYEYKGSLYSAFLTGWDLSLVVKTEPMTTVRRVMYVLGAAASIVASPILALISLNSETFELLILPLLAIAGAYYFSSSFIKSVRVERR